MSGRWMSHVVGHAAPPAWRRGMAALLLLALAAAALEGLRATGAERDRLAAAARLATTVPARRPAPLPAARPASGPGEAARTRALAEIVDRLDFDWPALFDDLEHLLPHDVTLLDVEPRLADASVRISISAQSPARALACVRALGQARQMRDVRLLKQDVEPGAQAHGSTYTITASLRGRSAAARGEGA